MTIPVAALERMPSPAGDERLSSSKSHDFAAPVHGMILVALRFGLVLSAAILVFVIDLSILVCVQIGDSITFYRHPKQLVGSAS